VVHPNPHVVGEIDFGVLSKGKLSNASSTGNVFASSINLPVLVHDFGEKYCGANNLHAYSTGPYRDGDVCPCDHNQDGSYTVNSIF